MLVLDNLSSELADNSELFEMSKDDGDFAGLLTIEGEATKLGEVVERPEAVEHEAIMQVLNEVKAENKKKAKKAAKAAAAAATA